MKKIVNIKYFLLMLCISAIIAFAISYFCSFDFLPIFFIIICVILINGFLETWEDEQRGGFNNTKAEDEDSNEN